MIKLLKGEGMAKSFALILLSISIAVAGQFFLKAGMNHVGRINSASLAAPLATATSVLKAYQVWLGLLMYALSAIVWIIVLSRVDLSLAYPMVGMSYVVVLLISAVFLKEHVTSIRWLGAVVICFGVYLISRS